MVQDLGVHGEDSLDGPPVTPLPVGLDQTNGRVASSTGPGWGHRSHDAPCIAKAKVHAYMPGGHLRIGQMANSRHFSTPLLAACQDFSISACQLWLHIRFMYSSQSCGPAKRLMMPPRAMNRPKGRALRRGIFPAAMSRPPVMAPIRAPRNTASAA